MKFLALDLGKFNSVCCLFDSKTRKTKFVTIPTKREHIDSIFKDAKADLVVMEACGPSGWINDLAQHHGHETLVCSTNEEAWRWDNVKRKTDRDDALKLARMAAMGELKGVHTPSLEHREFRSLVKYRKTLDERINKTKNTIRAWFVNHGIEIATGEKAWHTEREHINSFRKPLKTVAKSRRTSGSFHVSINLAKRIAMDALPSVAIHWHERFSSNLLGPRCGTIRGPRASTKGSVANKRHAKRKLRSRWLARSP